MERHLSHRVAAFLLAFVFVLLTGTGLASWLLMVWPASASATLQSKPQPNSTAISASAPVASPTCTPAWDIMTSPNGSTGNELRGTAALAVDTTWAVGAQALGTTPRTLIEHWDGNAW